MKFAVALFDAPNSPASRRALRFSEALLTGGHEIVRLFFYRDAVHNASSNSVSPQDEPDLPTQWREFITQHELDAVVCIAAALRRGELDSVEAERYQRPAATVQSPWVLSGLGQLHEAIQLADRLVSFGGKA